MALVYFMGAVWGVDEENILQGSVPEWETMVGDLCHRRALSISAAVAVSSPRGSRMEEVEKQEETSAQKSCGLQRPELTKLLF